MPKPDPFTSSGAVLSASCSLRALVRHHGEDDPRVTEARVRLLRAKSEALVMEAARLDAEAAAVQHAGRA